MSLQASDVIAGRTSRRTSPLLIAGFIGASVALFLGLLIYVVLSGAVPTVVGLLFALPTTVACVALVLLADRLEPEPKQILGFVFLWGAGVATLIALILNTAAGVLVLYPAFGDAQGSFLTATVVAPFVEETCKGSVLLILLLRKRNEIDGPTDGIMYAAMVGLGFAFVENINYYIQGLQHGVPALLFTVFLRGIASPLCHPMFTSMTGLGIAWAATHAKNRALPVLGGWVAAMFLHACWNGLSGLGLFPVAYILMILVLGGLITIIVLDRRRMIRLIGEYLPAYANTGAVTGPDLLMLGKMSRRREARAWARRKGGVRTGVAMGDYQLAATELALLHARAANRAVTQPVFQQRQQGLVAVMRNTHATVFSSMPAAPWAGPGGPGGPPQGPGGPPQGPYRQPPRQGPYQQPPQPGPYQQPPQPGPYQQGPPPGYGPPPGPPGRPGYGPPGPR